MMKFSTFPVINNNDNFTISGKILKEIILETKFARSTNESKLIHTGYLK